MTDNIQEFQARIKTKPNSPNTGQQTGESRNMEQRIEQAGRDAILVEDAALSRMNGIPVLEPIPSRRAPYKLTDPFILVHEDRGDTEFRGVLFWVNLARKDKQAEPRALVLHKEQIPVRQEGDAMVRVLVGEGSPMHLGSPGLILDVELPKGGSMTTPVPPAFQGFAYVLEGEAAFGANKRQARPPQLVLLGPSEELTIADAAPQGDSTVQRAIR